jgi:hypothetical protein
MKNSILKVSDCRVYSPRVHSAQKIAAVLVAGLSLAIASQPARAAEPVKIPMTADRWTTVAGTVNFVEHMGKASIELQPGDYRKGIPSGMASLKDLQFGNGTIEYDVSADNGMGADLISRAASKENFEMFYLRPARTARRLRTACNTPRRRMVLCCGISSRNIRGWLRFIRGNGIM